MGGENLLFLLVLSPPTLFPLSKITIVNVDVMGIDEKKAYHLAPFLMASIFDQARSVLEAPIGCCDSSLFREAAPFDPAAQSARSLVVLLHVGGCGS